MQANVNKIMIWDNFIINTNTKFVLSTIKTKEIMRIQKVNEILEIHATNNT
jgi:hypothetical protein